DSTLFTRGAFVKAMADFAKRISGNSGKRDAYGFLGKELYEDFENAFYSTKQLTGMIDEAFYKLNEKEQKRVLTQGRKRLGVVNDVKDSGSFIKILNIFSAHAEDANKTKFVREHLLPK